VSGTLQKNLSCEVTQSLHCFTMIVLEAAQALKCKVLKQYNHFIDVKMNVLERKNHKIADILKRIK
jgi:hypothetical protein